MKRACKRILIGTWLLWWSGAIVAIAISIAPVMEPAPFLAAGIVALVVLGAVLSCLGSGRGLALLVLAAALLGGTMMRIRLSSLPLEVPPGQGRYALVTGSTGGIGLDVARKLVERGWRVFLHGRSAERMASAAARLREAATRGGGEAIALERGADLNSLHEARAFVEAVLARNVSVSLAILNAGGAKAYPPGLTPEGFDRLLTGNCLSHALMHHLLLPVAGRVVHVSSLSSSTASSEIVDQEFDRTLEQRYDDAAYGRTKLCNVLAAACLASSDTSSVSVHPGCCSTTIGPQAMSDSIHPPLLPHFLWRVLVRPLLLRAYDLLWFPPAVCADTVLYAAFADASPGEFFGRFRPMPALLRHPLLGNATFRRHYCRSLKHDVLDRF